MKNNDDVSTVDATSPRPATAQRDRQWCRGRRPVGYHVPVPREDR